MTGHAPDDDTLIDAALGLIADGGWDAFTLGALARAVNRPLSEVYRVMPDRAALLAAWLRRLGAAALDAPAPPADAPARDRLFDAAMALFDAALPDREAARVLAIELARDPLTLLALRREAGRLAAVTLERAGLGAGGLTGALRVAGLLAILADVARIWVDDGPDQARTMAALDRRLRRAEGVLRLFGRTRRPAEPVAPDRPAAEDAA